MRTPKIEIEARPTSLMILIRSPTVRTARTRAGDDADGGEEEEQVEDAVALGFLEGDPGDGPDLHVRVTVSTKMSSRVSVRGLREMSRPLRSWMRPTTSSTRASS